MTVNNTYVPKQYTISAGVTTFSIPFKFVDDSHIRCVQTNQTTGVDTELTGGGVDFTIVGTDLETTVQRTVGDALTIYMVMPYKQQTDYVNPGVLDLETLENDLDITALERQLMADDMRRAIKSSVSEDSNFDATLPKATSDKLIGFNVAADGMKSSTKTDAQIAGSVDITDTVLPNPTPVDDKLMVFNGTTALKTSTKTDTEIANAVDAVDSQALEPAEVGAKMASGGSIAMTAVYDYGAHTSWVNQYTLSHLSGLAQPDDYYEGMMVNFYVDDAKVNAVGDVAVKVNGMATTAWIPVSRRGGSITKIEATGTPASTTGLVGGGELSGIVTMQYNGGTFWIKESDSLAPNAMCSYDGVLNNINNQIGFNAVYRSGVGNYRFRVAQGCPDNNFIVNVSTSNGVATATPAPTYHVTHEIFWKTKVGSGVGEVEFSIQFRRADTGAVVDVKEVMVTVWRCLY